MVCGFSLGLIAALAVYLIADPDQSTPSLATTRTERTTQRTDDELDAKNTAAATSAAEPANSTGETQFTFYSVLPEFEALVPESSLGAERDVRTTAAARAGNYIVQAGSFTALSDADRRKASIALLGFESQIQRVAIDTDVYHRVRIGPVSDLGELSRLRRALGNERIEYLLIDVPD
jgi:cell division protein FtsN